MKTIPIAEIVVSPTRQRRTFDAAAMQEFQEGIKTRGLLHPIILRQEEVKLERGFKDVFTLVAGERRLRAIESLASLGDSIAHDGEPVPLGHIPYTLFTDLSPLAAEEAEYEENSHRADLTWQEKSAAVLRLKRLREAQAASAGAPPPSIADLASEIRGSSLGHYQEATRREYIVGQNLHRPEIAAAKTADEAYKILRRIETTDKSRALGESVGRTYSTDALRLLNADSLDWMKGAAAEQFDVILTDPPYGMSANEFGDAGGSAIQAHHYEDDKETYLNLLTVCKTELFRLAKSQAHLYWFCDLDNFHFTRETFEAAGWWVHRTPFVWYKSTGNRIPWPDNGPQRKYEIILYAVKGKKKIKKFAGDVLMHPADTNLGLSAQKPVALFEDFLSRSVDPGDVIFDPFGGTGPALVAAFTQKCYATVIEQDPASYGIAVARLQALNAQPELPL